MSITVSRASPNDLSAIVAYSCSVFGETNMADLGWNAVIARQTYKTAFAQQNYRVFVARKDGVICGVLVGVIDTLPFSAGLHATDVVFSAKAGGDMLLDMFVAWCKLNKVRRIDMGVSQEGRDEAITKLYERRGFVATGRMFLLQEK